MAKDSITLLKENYPVQTSPARTLWGSVFRWFTFPWPCLLAFCSDRYDGTCSWEVGMIDTHEKANANCKHWVCSLSTHIVDSKCTISSKAICQTISIIYWIKVSVPSFLVSKMRVLRVFHIQKDETASQSLSALCKNVLGFPNGLLSSTSAKTGL